MGCEMVGRCAKECNNAPALCGNKRDKSSKSSQPSTNTNWMWTKRRKEHLLQLLNTGATRSEILKDLGCPAEKLDAQLDEIGLVILGQQPAQPTITTEPDQPVAPEPEALSPGPQPAPVEPDPVSLDPDSPEPHPLSRARGLVDETIEVYQTMTGVELTMNAREAFYTGQAYGLLRAIQSELYRE